MAYKRTGLKRRIANRKRNRGYNTVKERNERLWREDQELNCYNYKQRALPLYKFYSCVLRELIRPDITAFRKRYYAQHQKNGLIPCQSTKKYYLPIDMECDHYKPKFRELTRRFLIENNIALDWSLFKPIEDNTAPIQEDINPEDDYKAFIASIPIHDNSTPLNKSSEQYAKELQDNIKERQLNKYAIASEDNQHKYQLSFLDNKLNKLWIKYHNQYAQLRMINKKLNQKLM